MSKQPLSNKAETKASNLRRVLAQSDPVQLGPSSSKLPEQTPLERKDCVFYADDGGYLSTGERNEGTNELYFIGVIDILTPYNIVKRTEHFWKSLSADKVPTKSCC
jgi:1-phosphatidylinositol-4-phosphate 5-kinase